MEEETTAVSGWNTSPRTYSLPSYAPAFAKYMSSRDSSKFNQSTSGMRPELRSPVPRIPSYPQKSDSPLSQIRPAQHSPKLPRSLVSGTSFCQSRSQVRSPQRSHRSLMIQRLDLACKDLYLSTSLLRSPLKSTGIQYLDLAVTDLHQSISLVRPPVKSLTDREPDFTNLQNADDDGLFLQDEVLLDQTRPPTYSLVGRFLTNGGIMIHTMTKILKDLWRPAKGLCIISLGPNLYQFYFFDELDRVRVIKGGPWTIEDQFLQTKRLDTGQNPYKVTLSHVDLWVRLQTGLIPRDVAIIIGRELGEFIEPDSINFIVKDYRVYMRIRVSIDIRRPLKRNIDIDPVYGKYIMHIGRVQCTYEGLPAYCFHCHEFGHYETTCPRF